MPSSQNENLIVSFDSWLRTYFLLKISCPADIVKIDHADPPCLRVDVFSKDLAGRITLRLDGLCDAEVINSHNDDQVFYKHLVIKQSDNFDLFFAEFINYFVGEN